MDTVAASRVFLSYPSSREDPSNVTYKLIKQSNIFRNTVQICTFMVLCRAVGKLGKLVHFLEKRQTFF
jgi:hypothetical protein